MKQYITNHPGIRPELLAPLDPLDRGPIVVPPAVPRPRPAAVLARLIPPWLPARRTLLVPCGRNAIYHGYRAMRLGRSDRILVPAFVCDTVSEPLLQAGANIVFFNVRPDMSIDWADLRRRLDRSVRAMLWYHFLGLPVELDEVLGFCREHRLLLVEDCAHALFAEHRGRPAGSFGDLAIFSIHKMLPVPRAGALVINNPRFKLPPAPTRRATGLAAALIAEAENHLHRLYLQSLDFTCPVACPNAFALNQRIGRLYADASAIHAVDETSLRVMQHVDPAAVRRNRRRNFASYLEHLADIGLFKRMAPGAAPIGFPVRVGRRDAFRRRLKAQGVESLCHWPAWLLPKGVARRFPQAVELADSILSLPCHHDLGDEQIDYVCRAVRKAL